MESVPACKSKIYRNRTYHVGCHLLCCYRQHEALGPSLCMAAITDVVFQPASKQACHALEAELQEMTRVSILHVLRFKVISRGSLAQKLSKLPDRALPARLSFIKPHAWS